MTVSILEFLILLFDAFVFTSKDFLKIKVLLTFVNSSNVELKIVELNALEFLRIEWIMRLFISNPLTMVALIFVEFSTIACISVELILIELMTELFSEEVWFIVALIADPLIVEEASKLELMTVPLSILE